MDTNRCRLDNRRLLSCIAIPISSRRTNNGMSKHSFERARQEQVRDLMGDQQIILTTTLSRKW
ncbi:hypothetical protein IEQ34_002959 [Dendrobium chrysotoxum]|uniref:Uncharacterized protein n=1 Tax=Dendrobium chrysotoxum TaxID=161865 RepID=A0AAV7HFX8_DENCH|nr:hypothetical protein IEQ34_002959 [Dendrobium chrysotoxum]